MRVQKDSQDKLELITRTVDGRTICKARLYDDFKAVTIRTEEESRIAYDCEMIITEEREFSDEYQARNYYANNFAAEFNLGLAIERYRERKEASDEARNLLSEFDYVITKLSESALLLVKDFAQRSASGESVSFNDFIREMNESIIAAEQDKGASFFSDRADQRDIVNGLQPRSMKL